MTPQPRRTAAQLAGGEGEDQAARFLERQGLTLITRNYRTRFGEIDLICAEGEVLVFVEVRLRSSSRYGGAVESITQGKQRRIIAAAGHFLTRMRTPPRCRFDVVLLQEGTPQWIKAAFEAR